MHIIHDENGNPIPHQGHNEHHHQNHREKLALLTYMLQHNEHHAAELEELADEMEKEGWKDTAAQIREGAAEFGKGNQHLKKALETAKEER